MRLFIIRDELGFSVDGDVMKISESRIVRHAFVLRLHKGEHLAIQIGFQRYYGELEEYNKSELVIQVSRTEDAPVSDEISSVVMAVALPNTGAKLDLIVEKLTEVGVSDIVFFVAERSQLRSLSAKKLTKLSLRALEASEQSNRWLVPSVRQMDGLEGVLELDGECLLFDQGGASSVTFGSSIRRIGLIGPEGGWSDEELSLMSDVSVIGLGKTILRMETAAIVGGWVLSQGGGLPIANMG